MSGWSAYAEAIKATGHCDNAALIGIQGGVWGTSEGFNLAAGEDMAIAAFFANPVPGGKLRIAGGEYMVLRFDADDKCAILRKGQTGAVLVGTNSSICIGTHNEKQPAGDANNAVFKTAASLAEAGY